MRDDVTVMKAIVNVVRQEQIVQVGNGFARKLFRSDVGADCDTLPPQKWWRWCKPSVGSGVRRSFKLCGWSPKSASNAP